MVITTRWTVLQLRKPYLVRHNHVSLKNGLTWSNLARII